MKVITVIKRDQQENIVVLHSILIDTTSDTSIDGNLSYFLEVMDQELSDYYVEDSEYEEVIEELIELNNTVQLFSAKDEHETTYYYHFSVEDLESWEKRNPNANIFMHKHILLNS